MSTLKKVNSMRLEDDEFDEMAPKFQLVVLEDEKNDAQRDLAFAVKAYENLQKTKLTASEIIKDQFNKSWGEIKDLYQEMEASILKSINPILNPLEALAEYDKSDELLDAALDSLLQPLLEALKPFLELPEMPDLPMLDALKDLIQTIKDMGRIQAETKKYLKKKKKETNEPEDENEKEAEEALKDKRSFLQKVNESAIGRLFAEIVKLFTILAQQLAMFIMFFFYYLISELIEMLKPVFEAFGIVAGTFIGMLFKLKDVLSSGFNIGAILLIIVKLIWEKLEETYNILCFFSPESQDDQIEAMRQMIAENRVRIEYCGINMDAAIAQMQSNELNKFFYDRKPNISKMRKDAAEWADDRKDKVSDYQKQIDKKIKIYKRELEGNGSNVPNKGAHEPKSNK